VRHAADAGPALAPRARVGRLGGEKALEGLAAAGVDRIAVGEDKRVEVPVELE
jgi:hypothetical protein